MRKTLLATCASIAACENALYRVDAILAGLVAYRAAVTEQGSLGEFLSDGTFNRITYSVERAFAEADKGALYESLVIVRMALEQLAWALAIRDETDPKTIRNTSATKSLTSVVKRHPGLGRLNGWLSTHAHWGYDAQIKAMFANPGWMMRASSPFKATAYIAVMSFAEHFVRVMSNEIGHMIDWNEVRYFMSAAPSVMEFDAEVEISYLGELVSPLYPDLRKLRISGEPR